MKPANRIAAWTRRLAPLVGLSIVATLLFPITALAAADPAHSTITGTSPVVANGTDTSTITITLRDASNVGVSGVIPTFTASGSNNTYGTCSSSDVNGVSTCTLSSTTAETKALSIATPIVTTGGNVVFVAGPFAKLQLLVPGETAAPGSATGKTGSPLTQTVGVPFNVIVNGVDANWNLVSTASDNIGITSSGSGTMPPAATLSGGTRTFSVALTTDGATLTATDLTDGTKTASTSPSITLDSFVKLVVLLPGETLANNATCRTGTVTAQVAGNPFSITVDAVDSSCAIVNTVADTVHLTSTDSNAVLPANAALVGGTKSFSVTLKTAGSRTITASDVTNPAKAAGTSSSVTVVAAAFTKLQLLVPGETAAPGTATGKVGSPLGQLIGIPFTITVNAVDDNWNVVSSSDTVNISSTDTLATLPANAALVSGTKTFSITLRTTGKTITATDITSVKTPSTSPAITLTAAGPSVTINQAVGQADPTSTSPINFTVVFSAAVTGFATGDVTITGTAGGTKVATVTGSGTTYTVAVSGMTTSGTVIASIAANVANASVGGLPNQASTSTDNTVTWNLGSATITLTTSAPIPPGAHNPVILWGQGFTLGVQLGTNGANKSVQLQAQRDGVTWVTIANLTTDANGHASLFYTPVTNLYYRAVFAGTPDLVAGTSNTVRTVVRQLAVLRPTNNGTTKTINRNTSITFTTTVRPARPELALATVRFFFYRYSSGAYRLVTTRSVVINSLGLASTTFKFTTSGKWYVRSQALPTLVNANSILTLEKYSVR
jgi:hypothetical protein